MQNVYWFLPDANRFGSLYGTDRQDNLLVSFLGAPVGKEMPVFKFKIERGSGKLGDFPGLVGPRLPVVGQRAWETLRPTVEEYVEQLPVKVAGSKATYLLLNPLSIIDCLDADKSVFSHYSTGTISSIDKLVLKTDCAELPPVFRIAQFPADVYVSEPFKEIVMRNKLTGLKWVKVN